jgi:hypothetical protein
MPPVRSGKEHPFSIGFPAHRGRMQLAVARDTLNVIQTGSILGDLGVTPAIDGAFYFYALKCTNCGREFQFLCGREFQFLMDTYKGIGHRR